MGLEVIGAGFGRTGTLSMQAALEQLGYAPCYHFTEVIERRPGRNAGHRRAWVAFARGRRPMDWCWLFEHYRATVDFPMSACSRPGKTATVFLITSGEHPQSAA